MRVCVCVCKARTVAAAAVGARRVAAATAAPSRPDLWLPAAHLLACARARTDRPIRLDCVGSVDVCMSGCVIVGQSEHTVWLLVVRARIRAHHT